MASDVSLRGRPCEAVDILTHQLDFIGKKEPTGLDDRSAFSRRPVIVRGQEVYLTPREYELVRVLLIQSATFGAAPMGKIKGSV
jgi:hypothetical protein